MYTSVVIMLAGINGQNGRSHACTRTCILEHVYYPCLLVCTDMSIVCMHMYACMHACMYV